MGGHPPTPPWRAQLAYTCPASCAAMGNLGHSCKTFRVLTRAVPVLKEIFDEPTFPLC
jgi:hypothetical protein